MKPVRVSGTAYERGALIGEAFAPAMEQSLSFNRRYLTNHQLSLDDLQSLLKPYLDAATAVVPHLVQQLRGMADGADVPFLDVFFANAFEEVYGIVELGTPTGVPLERCTDVVLRSREAHCLATTSSGTPATRERSVLCSTYRTTVLRYWGRWSPERCLWSDSTS